ncbi:hypothetical protein M3Y99_00062600 [Aphelenchoides fujianensis]|nr:hypothetical protein M3Y99_00062600 [Aphelenchoides fujianensis]
MARNRRSIYPDLSAEMEATRSFESNDSGAKLHESSGEEEEETSERLVSNRSSGGVNSTRGTNQSAGYSFFDDSRSFSEIVSGGYDQFKDKLQEFWENPGERWKASGRGLRRGSRCWCSSSSASSSCGSSWAGPSVDDRVTPSTRFRAWKGNAAGKPPTVVLLAGAKTKIRPLVRNIAAAVRAKSDVFVWEEEVNEKTSRMELERSIFAALQSAPDRRRLLVLHAVDRLEAAAPLVLHSLADVESAPFKGITILVSVIADVSAVPPTSVPSARSKCNEVVSNHLLSSWTSADLSADQVHPIISRLVGVSVCVR